MDNAKLKSRLEDKVQNLQEVQQRGVTVGTADLSLAPADSNYIALTNNALGIIR